MRKTRQEALKQETRGYNTKAGGETMEGKEETARTEEGASGPFYTQARSIPQLCTETSPSGGLSWYKAATQGNTCWGESLGRLDLYPKRNTYVLDLIAVQCFKWYSA